MENNIPNNIQNYPPPAMSNKKTLKGKLYYAMGGLMIYEVIMYAVVIAVMILMVIPEIIRSILRSEQIDTEKLAETLTESGIGMILGVAAGCGFMILFFIKKIKVKQIFESRKKINAASFTAIFFILFGLQLPFIGFDTLVEYALNQAGFSAQEAIEAASGASSTISMMIYVSFVAPLAEEFIFRGYLMKAFEGMGLGKGYAIVITSLLFGSMHANLTQSIYAFFAGLVFGYAASEYGIKWSIAFHIINNLLLGTILSKALELLPETTGNIISYALLTVFFIGAIAAAVIKRKEVGEFFKNIFSCKGKYYGMTLANPLIIIFLIINFIFALMIIQKL